MIWFPELPKNNEDQSHGLLYIPEELSPYNEEEEVDELLQRLIEIMSKAREEGVHG